MWPAVHGHTIWATACKGLKWYPQCHVFVMVKLRVLCLSLVPQAQWIMAQSLWNNESYTEFINQTSDQSHQWFVCKCIGNVYPIRGQDTKNSVECDNKLIRYGEFHYELIYQVWGQSDLQFACKCTEIACPIRGQETDYSEEHNQKFIRSEANEISSSSRNVQKLLQ